MENFNITTKKTFELVDITSEVQKIITKSGVASGMVLIFSPHTTAGIICNEAESRLKEDILKIAETLKNNSEVFGGFAHDADEGPPARSAGSRRAGEAGNAAAHIVSSFSGNSRTFIIENGKVVLGTWQAIIFLELDGPRTRQVWVKMIPDHP